MGCLLQVINCQGAGDEHLTKLSEGSCSLQKDIMFATPALLMGDHFPLIPLKTSKNMLETQNLIVHVLLFHHSCSFFGLCE